MPEVRVKIDVPSGLIELEGEKEFVSTYLDKLLPLVEAVGFGRSRGENEIVKAERPSETHERGIDDNASTTKRRRRAGKNPPSGSSCRDRIFMLKDEGFFKKHQSPKDIVNGLAKKGWTHIGNHVSASLTQMFHKGELQRTKDGGGG